MISAISYAMLFGLVILSTWIVWIRVRGGLGFWVRQVSRGESWAAGLTLDAGEPADEDRARLLEIAALVRSLDRESGVVVRGWDRRGGTRFVGLRMGQVPETPPPPPYELRHLPAAKVLRVSGRSNTDQESPAQAARKFAANRGIEADFDHPMRLSGQSFWVYEWQVERLKVGVNAREPWGERIFRTRDIMMFPVLLTAFSLALLGTGNWGLFAVGVVLLIFLSGACKFVFVYQQGDESQEEHLQNY